MVKYRIIVSCGTNVTSVAVAEKLKELLKARGYNDVETNDIRAAEAYQKVLEWKPDCIVFTGNPPKAFLCPAFKGFPFITGFGMNPVVD